MDGTDEDDPYLVVDEVEAEQEDPLEDAEEVFNFTSDDGTTVYLLDHASDGGYWVMKAEDGGPSVDLHGRIDSIQEALIRFAAALDADKTWR